MCPISFNIYGQKLNEGHLSFRTAIIHFWDKPYQEINFKSHLNSVLICIKILSDFHISCFILIFVCAYFCKFKDVNILRHCSILVFCDQWNMMSDLKVSNAKITIVWVTLIFFWKKIYNVRFEFVPWRNVWFCFISIAWVHFSHKTEKFWILKSLKYFNSFW